MVNGPRDYKTPEEMFPICRKILNSPHKYNITKEAKKAGIARQNLYKWFDRYRAHIKEQSEPPKILFVDIETLPNQAYTWGIYQENINLNAITRHKCIATIAYKWLGETEVYCIAAKTPYVDEDVLERFALIWNQAEWVVGHNSIKFDTPMIRARNDFNGLPPLKNVSEEDTLRMARSTYGRSFNSNKLDHLAAQLGLELSKLDTNMQLWLDFIDGCQDARNHMIAYNKRDVEITERLFMYMQKRAKNPKINLALYMDDNVLRCKRCGSDDIEHYGFVYTAQAYKHQFKCNSCHGHSLVPKSKWKVKA